VVTIPRFIDAYRSWRQGKIPYRLLQDQAAVLINICRHSYRPIADALEVTDADIAWLLQQPEASQKYADLLGGNVYVCETQEDLSEVQGCDLDWAATHGGKWPCLFDTPIAWDDCRKLQEAEGELQWGMFLICWSDAGGPVYYVPKSLWSAARLEEHLAATNQVWNP
jgi:hypothetical protein